MKKLLIRYFSYLIVICVLISSFVVHSFAEEKDKKEVLENGYVKVTDFGANGKDQNDDYDAFEKALATGKNIYIPNGKFYVSKPIILDNRICKGTGSNTTTIVGISDDIKSPIFIMNGCSSLSDVYIMFDDNIYTNKEKQGERVGLQIGSENKPLLDGSVIRAIRFYKVGTGIYCPKNSGCRGVLFDSIEVTPYSYRGVDMQCENRIMNTYSNIYINAHLSAKVDSRADSGLALEGSEYSATLNQINIEHDTLDYPVLLRNIKNINISSIHIEGVNIGIDDMGLIFCENTSGYIAAYTNYFCYINKNNNSALCLGDNSSNSTINIGTIHVKGLNAPDKPTHPTWAKQMEQNEEEPNLNGKYSSSFNIFNRKSKATGNYTVNVKSYVFYSYGNDYDRYYPITKNGNVTLNIDSHKGEKK